MNLFRGTSLSTMFILLWCIPLTSVLAATQNDSRTLITNLFTGYEQSLRPLQDLSHVVEVNFTLMLTSTIVIDVPNQVVGINGYMVFSWVDENLRWTPSDYGGVTEVSVMSSKIWKPYLNLRNSLSDSPQSLLDTSTDTPIEVDSTGYVTWWAYAPMMTVCKLDMTYFPYDKHDCSIAIFTIGHGISEMVLKSTTPSPFMGFWVSNGEWDLIPSTIYAVNYTLPNLQTVASVEFAVNLHRLPGYFIINLLFPTCGLSFLNILVFILPADSGEKIGYSITVLLAVMLQLGLTAEFLPKSSEVVPLVTQYLTILTIISIMSVIVTVFILFLHHKKECTEKKKNTMFKVLDRFKGLGSFSKSSKTSGSKPGLWATKLKSNAVAESDSKIEPVIQEKVNPLMKWRGKVTSGKPNVLVPDTSISIVEVESVDSNNKSSDSLSSDTDSGIMESPDMDQLGISQYSQTKRLSVRSCSDVKPSLEDEKFDNKDNKCEEKTKKKTDKCEQEGQLLQQLSNNIDNICFVVFISIWTAVTLGYLIALSVAS